ncbi:MAG: hypothetical protein NC411_02860 [Bacteroides sp.]|nr:hypothetical protein [Bacteroides sp.]
MRCSLRIFGAMLLAAIVVACGRVSDDGEGMLKCGAYEVYADSIVRDKRIYTAISADEIEGAWTRRDSSERRVAYRSGQRMADALFTKAMDETPAYTPLEVYLSLGLLDPDESMAALRRVVSVPVADNEDFPYSCAIPYWGAAAWEIYCATGSRPWLREAFEVLTKMLARQSRINASALSGMVCGVPRTVSDLSAYYPAWMDAMDCFETFATSVNVSRAHSLEIASLMAAELTHKAEKEYQTASSKLIGCINDHLWFPDLQRYGQYLYGNYYPIASAVTDNEANALAILSGVATPEMGAALVGALPYVAEGVPKVYPYVRPVPLSPEVQTLFGLAAAKVRNPQAFTFASAALWNMALDSQLPALWPALVLKGIFGINLSPAGMTFSPMVSEDFAGDKRVERLRYREAVLDVSLNGTGDKIASFMIDSVPVSDHTVRPDLRGHHNVTITLSGNNLHQRSITVENPQNVLPTPVVKWSTPAELMIVNFDPKHTYGIFVNGVMMEDIDADHYVLRHPGTTVIDIVPSAGPGITGYSPRPHVHAPDSNVVTIHASNITPRRPPLHFIKDPKTASNYIELAARHNTRITCYANVPSEGDYFLTIGYSNGSERCALRTLDVNDRYAATVAFPPRQANDWVRVYPSTTSVVHLKEGVNKLSLTYLQGTILFNKLTLLRRS